MTRAATLTALSVILLALSNILPAGAYTVLVLASLLPAAAVLSCGLHWGMLCYAATAIMMLILFPGRMKTLLYIVLLGHYGISKCLIERLHCLPLEWLCKLVLCNAVLLLLWKTSYALLPEGLLQRLSGWLLCLLANGIFVLYDLGYSLAVGWLQRRLPAR